MSSAKSNILSLGQWVHSGVSVSLAAVPVPGRAGAEGSLPEATPLSILQPHPMPHTAGAPSHSLPEWPLQ